MHANPLTVVQLLPALHGGGVERGTVEVSRAVVQSGSRSVVISGGGPLVDTIERDGGEHIQLDIGRKSLRTLTLSGRLRSLLDTLQPDVVHARSRLPAWVAWRALAGMPSRPSFITTIHGLYSVSRYSAIMLRGDRVIAVSEAAAKYAVEHYPWFDSSKLVVIPRGVDRAVWHPAFRPSADWLASWQTACRSFARADLPLILLPGRVKRSKGAASFLELIAALQQSDTPVNGLLVGRGALVGRTGRSIGRHAERLGIMDNLIRLEHRDDMRELMAVSACVLSLSEKPESFGRTVLEALSLGVPVVGLNHGGVGEIMGQIYPEGLTPHGDQTALLATVRDVLRSPAPVPEEHPFTLQSMLDSTLALYRACQTGERGTSGI